MKKIFFEQKKKARRSFLLTAIFSVVLLGTSSLSREVIAHGFFAEETVANKCGGGEKMNSAKTEKIKPSKGKKMKSSSDKVEGFYPPFPFTREEIIEKITRVLTIEDGLITKDCVDTIFDVNLPVRVLGKDEIKEPLWTEYLLREGLDWYFAVTLASGPHKSMFSFYLNSAVCIGAEEFQMIAKNAGWKRISPAQHFINAPANLREEYVREIKGPRLFVDLNDSSYCIDSINVNNFPRHL